MFNIYIPSKGRAEHLKTLTHFPIHPVKIFVEPQDMPNYLLLAGGNVSIVNIGEDNKGIVYVRNFIKEYATAQKDTWYWMMDDDIQHFYRVHDGQNVVTNGEEVILNAENIIKKLPEKTAQVGLEYQQFSWSARKVVTRNSYIDVCVCNNVQATKKIKYRDVPLKEDRDFTLQCLYAGFNNYRINKLAMSVPSVGSNEGGLKTLYDKEGAELEAVKKLQSLWGKDVIKIVQKKDRIDAKINWKLFKTPQ